jgi:sugar phosphate isomerase/epimerase
VQIKGHTLLDPAQILPWGDIMKALAADGYKGQVGLETHYFDGTKIEKSHLSVVEIFRLLES